MKRTALDNEPMYDERFDFLLRFAERLDSTEAGRLLECLGEIERLKLSIAKAVEAEREEIARLADDWRSEMGTYPLAHEVHIMRYLENFANAIRARGDARAK